MAQMLKRAEIIVKGEVQRVGYKDAVERIARKLNIKGYAENLVLIPLNWDNYFVRDFLKICLKIIFFKQGKLLCF